MKIIASKFAKFLDLVNVAGAIEIRECIAVGIKQDLKIIAKTPSNTFALKAVLKGDFSDIETVGIDDLALLKKVVELGDEEIEIKKKENTLIFKNKTSRTKLILRNVKYILTALEEEAYDKKVKTLKNNSLVIRKEDIQQIAKYYDVFKGKIYITGKDNSVIFRFGTDENVSEVKIEVKNKIKDFDICIAGFLIEALLKIADNVTVYANTDMPVILGTETDDYTIEYLIAPLKREENK